MTLNELCSKAYYKNKYGIILNMDCVEAMKLMPDECIDLTVTSPPYDNLRTYEGFSWDFELTAKELYRITKQGGVVVWVVGDATIKGSETGTSFKQALYFKEIGFNLHDTMIYHKNGTGACGSNYCYWQSFEYMFVLSKGRPKTINRLTTEKLVVSGGSRIKKNGEKKVENRTTKQKYSIRSNVWTYNVGNANNDDKTSHPAVFPEALVNDHILSWSNENDIVFDPFIGSGTTAKMAMLNNRKFIGCELSKKYCEIIKERLENVERIRNKNE